MPDWKEMYLHLMRETERAVRILTEAQQACEELYLRSDGPEPLPPDPRRSSPLPETLKNSRFFQIFFPKTVDKPKFH